ncbi:MAG: hypothetical protein MJ220_01225 [Bacilli bacterium]|nr:hypothetical protein [Bacilli bacterium]
MRNRGLLKFAGVSLMLSALMMPLASCTLIKGITIATGSIQDKWNINQGISFFSNDWERLYNTRQEHDDIGRLYVFSTRGTSVDESYLSLGKNSDFEERWNYWIDDIEKNQTINDDCYDLSFETDYQWMWYVMKKSYQEDAEYVKKHYTSSMLAVYVASTERIYAIQTIS